MAVHVENGLPGRLATVHADVVAIRGAGFGEPVAGAEDELIDGAAFGFVQAEPVLDMAPGDDEQVAGRDRVAVQARIGQLVFQYRVGPAERAVRRGYGRLRPLRAVWLRLKLRFADIRYRRVPTTLFVGG